MRVTWRLSTVYLLQSLINILMLSTRVSCVKKCKALVPIAAIQYPGLRHRLESIRCDLSLVQLSRFKVTPKYSIRRCKASGSRRRERTRWLRAAPRVYYYLVSIKSSQEGPASLEVRNACEVAATDSSMRLPASLRNYDFSDIP